MGTVLSIVINLITSNYLAAKSDLKMECFNSAANNIDFSILSVSAFISKGYIKLVSYILI